MDVVSFVMIEAGMHEWEVVVLRRLEIRKDYWYGGQPLAPDIAAAFQLATRRDAGCRTQEGASDDRRDNLGEHLDVTASV
jgi:hypothetical protein